MKKITGIKIVVAPIDILAKELKNIRGGNEVKTYCKDGIGDFPADIYARGAYIPNETKVISAW